MLKRSLLSLGLSSAAILGIAQADEPLPKSLINQPDLLRAWQARDQAEGAQPPVVDAPAAEPLGRGDLVGPPAPPVVETVPVEPAPVAPVPLTPEPPVQLVPPQPPVAVQPAAPVAPGEVPTPVATTLTFSPRIERISSDFDLYAFPGLNEMVLGSLDVERSGDGEPLLLTVRVRFEWIGDAPLDVTLKRLDRHVTILGSETAAKLDPILIEEVKELGRTTYQTEFLVAASDFDESTEGEIYGIAVAVVPVFTHGDSAEPLTPSAAFEPHLLAVLDDRFGFLDNRMTAVDASREALEAYARTEALRALHPKDIYVEQAAEHAKSAWREASSARSLTFADDAERRLLEKTYFAHRYAQAVHNSAAARFLTTAAKTYPGGTFAGASDVIASHVQARLAGTEDFNYRRTEPQLKP